MKKKNKKKVRISQVQIIEYAKNHTVAQTAAHFSISNVSVYNALKKHNAPCIKNRKYSDEFIEKAKELAKTMDIESAYKELKCKQKFSSFRSIMYHYNIKFQKKKNRKSGYIIKQNRLDIDTNHLKKHAHEYTCTDYYRIFQPNCSRPTLINRAKELGVQFAKKTKSVIPENIWEIAEKSCGEIDKQAFYETYIKKEGISYGIFHKECKKRNIKFSRKTNAENYTSEEKKIIYDMYPVMGAKCTKYLPGRNESSVRNWASRKNIKYVGHNNSNADKDLGGNK